MDENKINIGIDIGSVTVKVVLLDDHDHIVFSRYIKHNSQPAQTLYAILRDIKELRNITILAGGAVTGSGRDLISKITGLPSVNEIVAQARAVSLYYPSAKTVIEIGGQDSKFIRLETSGLVDNSVIVDQRMNDICAAGTGAFIEQQAERMNIPIEEFGDLAMESKCPAVIAGRCTVFAKTDIIHMQQEGIPRQDMAAGICNVIARNYIAQFSKGRKFETPIIFQGGLAANKGVVKAFRDILKTSEDELKVPEHYKIMVGIGAAILSRETPAGSGLSLDGIYESLEKYVREGKGISKISARLPRLTKKPAHISTVGESKRENLKNVFMGIDVGSTSTCIALMDEHNCLIAKSYVLNKGILIDSVNTALDEIKADLGGFIGKVKIKGVGITGSGRALVSHYIGADVVNDEISAQAKAAVFMMPDVQTVFEIGGQDSKYIRIAGGRVIDFEMNKVCAAGTGSFLEEQAKRLGEDIHRFSGLAFNGTNPVDLGERCTVFMESDIVHFQQQGASKEDIISGLSYSIAKNYLEKVVRTKPVDGKILIVGGVAFNESVVSAFQEILEKEITIPRHHEVSAAIGIALIAKEKMSGKEDAESSFIGFDAVKAECCVSSFLCGDCSNSCRINKAVVRDTVFCYGGICGKYGKMERRADFIDLFAKREKLLFECWKKDAGPDKEPIGLPRGLSFYEFFPLFCVFLQELGYQVVLSDPTNKDIIRDGLEKTAIENCFANKIVYGHVADLAKKGVKRLFMPAIVEFERRVPDLEHNYACPFVQINPTLIRSSFHLDVISPVFTRNKGEQDWKDELLKTGLCMGGSEEAVRKAINKAEAAQTKFIRQCEALGNAVMNNITQDVPIVVVMGKVYNVHDPGLNFNLAHKLENMGCLPVPFDCLPLSRQALSMANYNDMIWASGQDLMRAAKIVVENKRLYPVVITNFGCGPDSFTEKYLSEIFSEKPCLFLEVDEHSSDIGIETRCEAFLRNIREVEDLDFEKISSGFVPFMPNKRLKKFDGIVYMPLAFDPFKVIAAAFESIGIRTKFLPAHDEVTEKYGKQFSSGKECLPFIMHVGDIMRMIQDPEFNPERSALCIPGTNVPCRVSVFPTTLRMVLKKLGYPQVPVIAPETSMDKDDVLRYLGPKFAVNLYRGLLSLELLEKKLTQTRPYEKKAGESDVVYEESVRAICRSLKEGRFFSVFKAAMEKFDKVEIDRNCPEKPVIGLVGDDYTRTNSYINNNFAKEIESLGGEVWNIPIYSHYLEFQRVIKPRMMLKKRRYIEYIIDEGKSLFELFDKFRINHIADGKLKCHPNPDFRRMQDYASKYLDPRFEPLLLIDLAHVIHLIKNGADGIVNLVGFQCIIHSIVTAALRDIKSEYDNLPVLTLYFDFLKKVHQTNRIEAFMYQVKQFKELKNKKR